MIYAETPPPAPFGFIRLNPPLLSRRDSFLPFNDPLGKFCRPRKDPNLFFLKELHGAPRTVSFTPLLHNVPLKSFLGAQPTAAPPIGRLREVHWASFSLRSDFGVFSPLVSVALITPPSYSLVEM